MRLMNSMKLTDLQNNTECIRNICIMAHVDHGKTTLADSLVASNGIISQRLAGKLRYMDSRKDEQERGITMKSSAIALYHSLDGKDFLINLIDSPGHVDFSSEVSTALRLCDGALVLVDVVEGVCAQTIVALRQAWQENIKPVLVLNKLDRLILELKLTPLDAYVHLTQVLEKVNAVMAEMFTIENMEKDLNPGKQKVELNSSTIKEPNEDIQELYDWNTGLEEADDSQIYFSPHQGNVVFASASDGWGFRIEDFAKIYSSKIGVKEAILNRTLWGDFFMNTKRKRIMKGAQEKAKKSLFVQLILENIWAVYDAVVVRKDKLSTEKIISNLQLQIPPRDLKQTDAKSILYAVTSNWLPLSRAILEMVCVKLPSPLQLSENKIERLMSSYSGKFASLPTESKALKAAFLKCSRGEDAPVIIFVSKMFAIETKCLPENKPKMLTALEISERRQQAKDRLAQKQAHPQSSESADSSSSVAEDKLEEKPEDSFIAFARIYSGTLKKGKQLFVLGPRHDPGLTILKLPIEEGVEAAAGLKDMKQRQHFTSVEINNFYLLMGRELEALDEVPAGCILGIGGLEEHILKTATISSTLTCPPFTDINFIAVPILRVALETRHPSDMASLRHGLKLLNQADPCVQMFVQETGEHVLVTSGEIHLQRCLDDLTQRFAKVEITVSEPIVPFRETIVIPPKTDMVNEIINSQQPNAPKPNSKSDSVMSEANTNTLKQILTDKSLIIQQTSNRRSTIKIRALPLPVEVTELLEEFSNLIKLLAANNLSDEVAFTEFREKLRKAFACNGWASDTVDKIWSFGPKKCGPNLLINNVASNKFGCIWSKVEGQDEESGRHNPLQGYYSNFVNGFQLATIAGPLCEEPMQGIAFSVEDWVIEEFDDKSDSNINQPFGPFSGQIMSAVKEACRKSFQAQPQRLMVAMYSSSIQVNSEALGTQEVFVSEQNRDFLNLGTLIIFSIGG